MSDNAFEGIFSEKWNQLKWLFARLIELDYILKNSFALPKLIYLLRVTPTWNQKEMLEEMDSGIKSTTETLINAKVNQKEWIESPFSVRCGVLGIRKGPGHSTTCLFTTFKPFNGLSALCYENHRSTLWKLPIIRDYQNGIDAWNSSNKPIRFSLYIHRID